MPVYKINKRGDIENSLGKNKAPAGLQIRVSGWCSRLTDALIAAAATRVLSAFAPGFAGLIRCPFVRHATLVRYAAAFPCNLPLVFRIHSCKTAVRCPCGALCTIVLFSLIFHVLCF